MATTKREQLKKWFKEGSYPKATEFADWMDSFWHQEEDLIPIANIDELKERLNSKFDRAEGEDLQIRMDEAEERLDVHDTNISALFKTQSEHETWLENHDEQLEEHTNRLDNHANRLDTHDERLDDHDSHLKRHDADLAEYGALLENHEERLLTAEQQIVNHENRIVSNEKDISEIKDILPEKYDRLKGEALEQRTGKAEERLDVHEEKFNDYLPLTGGPGMKGRLFMNRNKLHLGMSPTGVAGISFNQTNGVCIESAADDGNNNPNIILEAKGNIHLNSGQAYYNEKEIATVPELQKVTSDIDTLNQIIQTEGEGNKLLADDGTYKELSGSADTVKDKNQTRDISFWIGTTEEYEALPVKDENTIYHII